MTHRHDKHCPIDHLFQILSVHNDWASTEIQERYHKLLLACMTGGIGPSSNVLLWNAAGVIKELAKGHPNEVLLDYMADDLRRKGELERQAVDKCTAPNNRAIAIQAIKGTCVGTGGKYRGIPFFRPDICHIIVMVQGGMECFADENGADELVRLSS